MTEPVDWQPMETAPKDGRTVRIRMEFPKGVRAYWDNDLERWVLAHAFAHGIGTRAAGVEGRMSVEQLTKQGLQDGLVALAKIGTDIKNAERRAEQRAGEAEAELNSLRRLRGFVDLEVELHRARLRAIEDAESREKPS